MAEQPSVSELVLRWQEGRQWGEKVTAEALCAACPQLLDEVRRRIEALPGVTGQGPAPSAGTETLNSDPGTPAGPHLFPWLVPSSDALDPDATREQTSPVPTVAGALPPGRPSVPGYEILGELGRGGMGVVYKARQTRLHRLVALKMILSGGHAGELELGRFRAEAEAVARLQHPNIVQIHEVGESEGRPFFSLELVEGGNLAGKLRGSPVPARQTAQLVEVLARAMHYAHQHGIVHRDLKPANILLARSDRLQAVRLGAGAAEAGPYEPKVTDFGLAKRLDLPAGQTQSGAVMGTPSYMAPEQALGQVKAIGPATDVYALGAILYELLTGHPPFRAAELLDTLSQVVNDDPVPPSRLQLRIPRDLETVCLKCLRKEPGQRYPSAEELAEDLRRFLSGEPVRARPIGRVGHLVRWARRRPAVAALWGVSLAAGLILASAGLWLAQARAEADRREALLRQGVAGALDKVAGLQQQARWGEAEAVLEQAQERLEDSGSDDLRRQLDRARADLRLVRRLEAARLQAVTVSEDKLNYAGAEWQYQAAFRKSQLGQPGEDVDTVAARVRNSAVKEQLVAALDDWAWITGKRQRRAWLLAVARQADPDPWRDRFRDPGLWRDRAALERLARQARVEQLSPQLVRVLGLVLRSRGADALPLLMAAQRRLPQDFWFNFQLGIELYDAKKVSEAIGYYRAALALRPSASAVYNNLGSALTAHGQFDQAIACFRRAIDLDPRFAPAHNNLGNVLQAQRQLAQAIECYKKAIKLDSRNAMAHYNLGRALKAQGQVAQAIESYKKAIVLDTRLAPAHNNLGVALNAQGQVAQAIESYKKALTLDPRDALVHNNLGGALYARGQVSQAIECYQQAIALNPSYAPAHTNLALALQGQGQIDQAIACYQKAIALDPKYALAHGALGQALFQQGRFREARASTRRCLQLVPRHHPWFQSASQQLAQCERFLALDANLPALLKGKTQLTSATQRLEYAILCRYKKLYSACARFSAEALAANSQLADDLASRHRYNAASYAALAGAGQGNDAGQLGAQARARLRRQSLAWLRADLTLWTRLLRTGQKQARAAVQRQLQRWQRDPDLAGIRDAAWIVNLPAEELRACRQLWADVDQLLNRAGG
jgi:serine/threonine-protein kinase